jgi:hypothetical protein
MQGKVSMSTVKMHLEYFPTAELALQGGRWERIEHPHKQAEQQTPSELEAYVTAKEDKAQTE